MRSTDAPLRPASRRQRETCNPEALARDLDIFRKTGALTIRAARVMGGNAMMDRMPLLLEDPIA